MSPISSSRRVPPLADSKSPCFPFGLAPENAPFSYPKSSDSRRLGGIEAQFTLIKGLLFRSLNLYISSATISLPTPDSPVIKTVASVGAALLIVSQIFFSAGELPIRRAELRSSALSCSRTGMLLGLFSSELASERNCWKSSCSARRVKIGLLLIAIWVRVPFSSKIGTPATKPS